MAIDMDQIEKLQEQLHGEVLAESNGNGERPEPEDLLAVPEDVWGMNFSTWIQAFERFFREESHGGTCMENHSRSRFFEGFSAMYWDLMGDNPGAIIQLPVYSKHGARLISDNDRLFPEDQTPMETYFGRGSGGGLWVPLSGADTLPQIQKRIKSMVERYEKDMARSKAAGSLRSEDRRYYEKAIARFQGWL